MTISKLALTDPKRQARDELQAHKRGHLPAIQPTRLDQLATKGIASTVDVSNVSDFGTWHGLEVLELTKELLNYSDARAASGFGQANFQKLFAALLNYQRHFAADEHWQLVDADIVSATLRWRCSSTALPDVVDSVTRTHRLAATAHPETDPTTHTGDRPAVLRECDLTNPKTSRLTFPNERRTVTWCVADDPIHMRADAFPHVGPTAVGVAVSPTASSTGGDVLDGRWAR